MNPKIKDVLGWVAVAAIVLATFGALRYVNSYARSVPAAASFSATGEGHATAIPDVVQFSFGVTTEGGKDIGVIQKENTGKANASIAFVKSKGVDAKDISTQSYTISPRYESCPPVVYSAGIMPSCNGNTIIGYVIDQQIAIKVRDFSKIGDVMSGVTAQGANNVSGLQFIVHDRTEVENEARAKAIVEAKAKAEAFAKAGNFRLGRIISIQESGNYPSYVYNRALDMAKGGAGLEAAPSPSIEPGSQEISSNVTIVYEIK